MEIGAESFIFVTFSKEGLEECDQTVAVVSKDVGDPAWPCAVRDKDLEEVESLQPQGHGCQPEQVHVNPQEVFIVDISNPHLPERLL
mmetsp:Transcript_99616/g.192362  ORF Transcript_99616/g.192362 Transcript_99616/m.192362 type:complete len:87 (+) Transcript_99616:134-394(+)